MTISILNYKIFNTDKDKLTPIQKLYLFFISYLIDDNTIPKKILDLKHALRKLDIRLQLQQIYLYYHFFIKT